MRRQVFPSWLLLFVLLGGCASQQPAARLLPTGPLLAGPLPQADDLPVGPAEEPVIRPAPQMMQAKLDGDMPRLPRPVIDRYLEADVKRVNGTYRICLGRDGLVDSVAVEAGIEGADADIQRGLRTWRFAEQPVPVCFVKALSFPIVHDPPLTVVPIGVWTKQECLDGLASQYRFTRAYHDGVTGETALRIRLDANGEIVAIEVARSLDPELDELAMNWLKTNYRCKFTAALDRDSDSMPYTIEQYTVPFSR